MVDTRPPVPSHPSPMTPRRHPTRRIHQRTLRAVRRLAGRPVPIAPIAVDPVALATDDAGFAAGVRPSRRRTYLAATASGLLLVGGPSSGALLELRSGDLPDGAPMSLARVIEDDDVGTPLPVVTLEEQARRDAEAREAQAQQGPIPLAVIDDVEMVIPDGEPVVVGFHEAGGPSPRPLVPTTVLHEDHHHAPVPRLDGAEDVDHQAMVLPSRGRGTHPTSAVDVALAPDAIVTAPVTGEVLTVGQYTLYGNHSDWMIRIRPDSDPTKVVELVHVVEPTVHAGERVEAGVTQIAQRVKPLPFASQIDQFAIAEVGHAVPHVHIEVEEL